MLSQSFVECYKNPVNLFHSEQHLQRSSDLPLRLDNNSNPNRLRVFVFTVELSSSVLHNVASCFWFWGIWITCCAGSDSCRSPLVIIQVSWSQTAAFFFFTADWIRARHDWHSGDTLTEVFLNSRKRQKSDQYMLLLKKNVLVLKL